ncbi:MAG: hypothetical protein HY544_01980 [Candidatus Diapherotrites archaeon]|uniref:Aminomethyltransferase folate-binding domain-containing protein n=1 Tax=Candidatus Iainarchaeum sp. TaxID=3101447 RepID=A0A8T3YI89_9ARCH|nr:hypothetical protein [Candidatus Diapherotrites archaeon]
MEGKYFEMPFTVLKLCGRWEKLMNGLSSNTPQSPRNAFLDVYGRTVAAFFQVRTEDGLLIALPEQFTARLDVHLKKYLAIGKASLDKTNLHAFLVAGKGPQEGTCISIPEKNCGISLSEFPPHDMERMGEPEFLEWRIENGLSLQGVEFDSEMIMNTDWQDAVSFTKGCFLGQEIAVKVTRRGRPPKRLVRMAFVSEPMRATRGDFEVGEVKSKCLSEKRGKWIAYCSIPNDGLEIDGGKIIG